MAEVIIHGSWNLYHTDIYVGQAITPRNLVWVTTWNSDHTNRQLICWQSQIQCGSEGFVQPHLSRGEKAVTVSIVHQHRIDAGDTVGNRYVGSGNGHITDVGHLIGPGDVGSSGHHRHAGTIGVILVIIIRVDRIDVCRRIGRLLYRDSRLRVAVVAGIRIHVIWNHHHAYIPISISLARS